MIVNYGNENPDEENFLVIFWLFLVVEFIELCRLLGAYDDNYNQYNIRKIFWFSFITLIGGSFLTVIGIACFKYILHN